MFGKKIGVFSEILEEMKKDAMICNARLNKTPLPDDEFKIDWSKRILRFLKTGDYKFYQVQNRFNNLSHYKIRGHLRYLQIKGLIECLKYDNNKFDEIWRVKLSNNEKELT